MKRLILDLKADVKRLANSSSFIHHTWFIQYHLEIVEEIAFELCERYPMADKNLVTILVWFHDYGKIVDHKNQYKATLSKGTEKLLKIGFEESIVTKIITFMDRFDKKLNLSSAPIELQIVSSADGASHLVGPFFPIFWKENNSWTDKELMEENRRKILIDWEQKITLPEIKNSFLHRHKYLLELSGQLPTKYLSDL